MSRGVQTFKQRDVTKALKGAEKAGFKVQRAEVRRDGSILLDFDRPAAAPPASPDPAVNEWDEVGK
jgi:hypothetical protein